MLNNNFIKKHYQINQNSKEYTIKQYQNKIERKIKKINTTLYNTEDKNSLDEDSKQIEAEFQLKKITKINFIDFDVNLDDESIFIDDDNSINNNTKASDVLQVKTQIRNKQMIDYNNEIQKLIDYTRNPEHIINFIKFVN